MEKTNWDEKEKRETRKRKKPELKNAKRKTRKYIL